MIKKIVLNTAEAAHYIGVEESDLAASRDSGYLRDIAPPPFIKIGDDALYQVRTLELWVYGQTEYRTYSKTEDEAQGDDDEEMMKKIS